MLKTEPFLYLAPIRGLTDALFRSIFFKHFGGFDAAVAPFINPQRHSHYDDKMLRDVLPQQNKTIPLVPQLLHTDPESFLVLAARLNDLGYTHINWNLGCPAPMVTRKKRGSGILPYPDMVLDLLDEIVPHLKVELSIKTRLGFASRMELANLLPRLDAYPLKEIIIHTRLGKQLYKGSTDPDGFAICQGKTKHTLVYNGDITDLTVFKTLADRFPQTKRWMIGRGALADPFLAEEIKGMTTASEREKTERLRAFHADLFAGYQERLSGPSHILGRMKQLWLYLIRSFPDKEKLVKKIVKSNSLSSYQIAVEQIFGEDINNESL